MSLDQLLDQLGNHTKSLVIDKSLSSSINALIPFTKLKIQTNIQDVYWFNDDLSNFTITEDLTILIKSKLENVSVLGKRLKELPAHQKIDLIITNDFPISFKHQLDTEGLLGNFNSIEVWNYYIKSDDIITLDLSSELSSLYNFKTSNVPFKLANLLNNYLIETNQSITHVLSKGSNSSKLYSIYKNLNSDYIARLPTLEKKKRLKIQQGLYGYGSNNSGKQLDLVIFERNLDFMSVLLNQLTYIGIIDETFSIDINSIKIDDELILLESLESTDSNELFDTIKFKNFGIACDYLNTNAKSLQSRYDELTTTLNNKNSNINVDLVNEIKKLEDLKKQISLNTKISETILSKLNNKNESFDEILEFQTNLILRNISYTQSIAQLSEYIMEQNFTVNEIIRLLGIISIINNGLREKDFNSLSDEILQFYGFDQYNTIFNLVKIGIISIRGDLTIIKNFYNLNTKLNLTPDIDENENLSSPTTPTFAYRGYVPLIVRLIENGIKPNHRSSWSELDLNSLILGKTIDEELVHDNKGKFQLGGKLENNSNVLIVMIGGITYSELALLKFVEQQYKKIHGVDKKFIILTDSFINAKKLIESYRL